MRFRVGFWETPAGLVSVRHATDVKRRMTLSRNCTPRPRAAKEPDRRTEQRRKHAEIKVLSAENLLLAAQCQNGMVDNGTSAHYRTIRLTPPPKSGHTFGYIMADN